MLTPANAIEVLTEAQKLSHLPSGNHGRTFRRFLGRMLQGQVLALVFADGATALEAKELKLYKKYAEQHLEKLTAPGCYLDDMQGAAVVVEAKRSYVAIHFPMEGDTESMSQNAMRSLLYPITVIAKSMKAFAENPAGELYIVSPEGIKERRRQETQQARERHARFMQALERSFPARQLA